MKIKEILAACLLLAATGCTFTDELQVCPYSTRIEYWYAGNTFENALPAYANSLRQYLFDEEGNLLATDQMRGDSVTFWNGELPAGRYTVVAWGNLENEETVTDSRMLTANGGTPPAYRGNTDRLYYGSGHLRNRRRRSLPPAHLPHPGACPAQYHGGMAHHPKTARNRDFSDAAAWDTRIVRFYTRL